MLEGLHVNIPALITLPNLHFASPQAKQKRKWNETKANYILFRGIHDCIYRMQ